VLGARAITKPGSALDKISVLLADGESAFALPVLRCLSCVPGVRTTVVARAPWAPIRFSRHAQRYVFVDHARDDERRVAALARIAKKEAADVVIAAGQRTIRLLSTNSEELSKSTHIAHVPDATAFDIAADKWELACFLERHGIAHPPTVLFRADQSFEDELDSLRFPVLIKPALGGSGHGIELFTAPAELRAHFAARPEAEKHVVQSYIEGNDIDCSVLCVDGRIVAHTIQREFLPGYQRFGPPVGVDFVHDAQTLELATRLVGALGWSGIAHIDMRYDAADGKVKIIEINPRYWGSLLGSLIAGVNFPRVACLAALGAHMPKVDFVETRYVAGRAAFDRLMRGLFNGRPDKEDRSCMSFVVQDPLPDLFGGLLRRHAHA